MKKPRTPFITAVHHDETLHPIINVELGANERLAHSRQCPHAADDEAAEMVPIETDTIVGWYLDVLLLNLVKVPDPLIEFTVKDDRTEAMFMSHLLLFLLASGLAEEKLSSSHGTLEYVATKKLLRRSGWLQEKSRTSGPTSIRVD